MRCPSDVTCRACSTAELTLQVQHIPCQQQQLRYASNNSSLCRAKPHAYIVACSQVKRIKRALHGLVLPEELCVVRCAPWLPVAVPGEQLEVAINVHSSEALRARWTHQVVQELQVQPHVYLARLELLKGPAESC